MILTVGKTHLHLLLVFLLPFMLRQNHVFRQSVVLAVVVAFMLHPTLVFVAAHLPGGGTDENHFVMFPGKATWGPSPLVGGNPTTGAVSPIGKVLSVVRPKDASKVVPVDEVKVGFPPLSTVSPQQPSSLARPQSRPAPTGYTVGASHSPVGPLVMLKGGIRGDSPFVLTRRQSPRSTGFLVASIKRLN